MGTSAREILTSANERWRARWTDSLNRRKVIHLVSCASTDITQPYHSYSYLAGALNQSGHAYAVRDLGIEFWNYVIAPTVVEELRRACLVQAARGSLDRTLLARFYAELLEDSARFERAWKLLQARDTFFDLAVYLNAIRDLNHLPRLLTLLSSEAVYRTFSSMSPPGVEDDRINLEKFRQAVEQGFGIEIIDYFYDFHAERLAEESPLFVGLTIPFLSQLEHSFALGRRLRQRGVEVVLGGPIVAKFYKYIDDVEKLSTLSFGASHLVPGEGESLVTQLADRLKSGQSPDGLENLVSLAQPRPLERIHFENVDALPVPDYSLWDYSLYASPEPGGLYSPTRGCYWNKCTFCDYGLSTNGPTSPWRTRSPERVADDLRQASKFVRNFFFAVDVLSPAYALRLSEELIAQNVDIRWMADFRLESSFRFESVRTFRRAGCVGAAFGMESADQAVIDLICKGTKVDRLSNVVNAFVDAKIPVQLMGFLGFPGERFEQAQTTLRTAAQLSRRAATVAVGRFGLTPGSEVAKRPEAFGIEVIYEARDERSIPWELKWRHLTPNVDSYPEGDFSSSLRLMRGFPFPFLGATTTLHSLLYFQACPVPPFPIPQWSFDFEEGTEFYVIPFFDAASDTDGTIVVQSGLTGRVLAQANRLKAGLDAYFEGSDWPTAVAGAIPEVELRFLDSLVEHSLALFIPKEAYG